MVFSTVSLVHENQLLEQAHILLVLEQGTDQRRPDHLFVRPFQKHPPKHFSNRLTSCSFLSRAPTSGGTTTLSSALCRAASGMSSATSSLSQSSNSLVEGFFFRPGRLRTS